MGVDVVSGSSAACVSILGCSALDASAVALGSHGGHHLFINRIPPRLPKEDVERTILAQLKSLHVSRCSVIPQNSLKNKGYGFITLGGCPSPQDLDDIANTLNNRLQIGSRVLGVRVCTDAHRELLGLIGVGPGPDGCGAGGCCDDGEGHHDDLPSAEDAHHRATAPCIGSISAAAHTCLLVPHAVVGAPGCGSGLRSHRICTSGGPDVASEAGSCTTSSNSCASFVPAQLAAGVCVACPGRAAASLGVGPVSHPAARSSSSSSITSSGTTTTYGSSGSSSGSSTSGSATPSPAPSTAPTRCATPLPEDSGLGSGPCPGFPCSASGASGSECVCGGVRGLQGGAGDAACVCGGRGAALHAVDQVGRGGAPAATGRTCGARSDSLQRRCFGGVPTAGLEHTANGPCDKDGLLVAARSLSAPQPMPGASAVAAAVGQGHGAPAEAAEGREAGLARGGCGSSTRGRSLTGGPTVNGRGGSGQEARGQSGEAAPRRGMGRDRDREVAAAASGRRRSQQQQLLLGQQAMVASRMARGSTHHAHSYDAHGGSSGYSGRALTGLQEQKPAADRPTGAVANGSDAAASAASVSLMHQHKEAATLGRQQEQLAQHPCKHSVPCATHSSSNARQQLFRASAPAMGNHGPASSEPHSRQQQQQQQLSSSPSQSVRRQGPPASAAGSQGPSSLSSVHGPQSRHDLARRGRQPYGVPVQPPASMDSPGLACSPGHSPAPFASSPSPAQARMGAGHTWGGRADGSRQGVQAHAHQDRHHQQQHQQQYGQQGSVQQGGAAASSGRRQELTRHSAPVAHPGGAHRRVPNWPAGPPPGLQQQQQRQQGFAVHHGQQQRQQQQQHASAQRVTGTYEPGPGTAGGGSHALHAQAVAGPPRSYIQEEEQHIAGAVSRLQARTSGRNSTASRSVPLAAATAPSASATTAAALSSAVFGSPVCGTDMLAVGSLGRQGLAASLGAAGGLAGSFAYSYGSTPPYNRCSLDLMRPFLDTGDVDPEPLGTGGAAATEGAGGEADPLDLDPLDLEPMILQLLDNDDEDGEVDRHHHHHQQQQQRGIGASASVAASGFSLLDDGSSGTSRPATWSLGPAAAVAAASANASGGQVGCGGVFASPAAAAAAAAQAVMEGGLAAAWQSGDVTAAAAAAVAHAVGSFGGLGGVGMAGRGVTLSSSVDLHHMPGAWLDRYYGSAGGQVSASQQLLQQQQQQQQALLLARSSMPGAGYGDVGVGWDGAHLGPLGSLGGLVGSFGGLGDGGVGGGGGDGWLGEVGLSQSLPSRLAVRALNSNRNGGGGRF